MGADGREGWGLPCSHHQAGGWEDGTPPLTDLNDDTIESSCGAIKGGTLTRPPSHVYLNEDTMESSCGGSAPPAPAAVASATVSDMAAAMP